MNIILYHNPRCSKSRAALALLRQAGIEPTLIDYLGDPPSPVALTQLVKLLGIPPRELLRKSEEAYKTLNLARPDLSDAAIIDAIHHHPKLLERPIAVRDGRWAIVGRPPERVLELLEHD